ncbi:hypothetical protein TWF192_005618 [Orbilia oligospora]|uniref:Uncharacterized protein n=1 Tax=Orbilia oligospora TaxID=2813651 RepID=A0A6G1M9I7_ORBOL|nr:hypothetical protein TWF191_006106 [Orbilia oligospora]KAF3249544.1 hypothetical protein TWF192_005618 [Orbilia oligospora]
MAKQATIITDRRTEEQTIFPGESETWSDWDSAEWEYNGCSPFVLSQPGTVLDKIYYSPNNPNPELLPSYFDYIELHAGVSDCSLENPLRIYFESPKYGSFKAPNIQNLNRAKRILKLEDMEREEIPRFDPIIAQNLEDFLDQEARREFDMDPFDSILHEGLPKVDPSIGVNAWLLQAREKKEGYSIITEEQKDDRIQPEDASSETDIEIEEEEEEEVHLGQRVRIPSRVNHDGLDQAVAWRILADPITGMEIAEYTIWPDYLFTRPTSLRFVSKSLGPGSEV